MPTLQKAHGKMSESNTRPQKPLASPVLNRTQERQLSEKPLKELPTAVPTSTVVADGNPGLWPLDTKTCPVVPV